MHANKNSQTFEKLYIALLASKSAEQPISFHPKIFRNKIS